MTYVPHPDHAGPLTRLADGQAWHYVTDHLGTPQELYDDRREVVWAADFSAYGRTARQLADAVDSPIRFPGQYFDAESGLHYNRFRFYDPEVGRYVNQDPIGLIGGANPYTYADNRPAFTVDSVGLAAIAVGAEVGAAGGTAVLPGIGTIVGGVLGAVVGIGVTAWMVAAISTDKAGNKVSPIADTMQSPGNCSPDEHRRLQDDVDRMCKGERRSCRANMDKATVLVMRQRNVECGRARDLINKKCFAGGDATHRNEAIKAWESVAKCDGLLR